MFKEIKYCTHFTLCNYFPSNTYLMQLFPKLYITFEIYFVFFKWKNSLLKVMLIVFFIFYSLEMWS